MNTNRVDYFSQYDASIPKEWQPRSCGIAALWMALSFTSREPIPTAPELIQEGVESRAYVPGIGWKHDGLIALAQKYGSNAHRSEYKKQNEYQKGIDDIKKTIERGGVPIASITVPGIHDTHLVPLIGYDDDRVFYHEPAQKQETQEVENLSMTWDEFSQRWRRLVMFIEST